MTRGSIEKMKEYVTRTGVSYPANSKYQLVWNEICALCQLAEELPCEAIFLAFNYLDIPELDAIILNELVSKIAWYTAR